MSHATDVDAAADVATTADVATAADAPLPGVPLMATGQSCAGCSNPAAADPVGRWYLNVGGDIHGLRMTLAVAWNASMQEYSATLTEDLLPEAAQPIATLDWNPASGRLVFARNRPDGTTDWFDGAVVDGVIVGRMANATTGDFEPPALLRRTHFTGWNAARIDADVVPRAWEVTIDHGWRARLRIDRAAMDDPTLVGTLKVYASVTRGGADEEAQYDIDVLQWDGVNLEFATWHDGQAWYYTAVADGRTLVGAYTTSNTGETHEFGGVRAEVLSQGISPRHAVEHTAWLRRTTARLRHLMMAGDPAPLATTTRYATRDAPPIEAPATLAVARDDAMTLHPQQYTLSEVVLDEAIANPYGAAPLSRTIHLFVTVPTTPPPPGGYPVAITLNGHYGSAYSMVDPNGWYWYGDAFARRGYVVAAVDVSHRPVADRRGMYEAPSGDDEAHGNFFHPAIKAPGMDSDWEEDGERAWDAMRALDFVLQRPDVDPSRVVATGHSMGGGVTTVFGALDPRVSVTIPSGFTPDLGDLLYGTGHPCWRWLNADAREYISVSDYHALVAPRGLIVETGERDQSYSQLATPWASAKQVMRRSQSAFDGTHACVHFLHGDGHVYHVAEPLDSGGVGLTVPTAPAPLSRWDLSWQTDNALAPRRLSLFDAIDAVMP